MRQLFRRVSQLAVAAKIHLHKPFAFAVRGNPGNKTEVTVGHFLGVLCLHNTVMDTEDTAANLHFFLGRTERIDSLPDGAVELLGRCLAFLAERRKDLHILDAALGSFFAVNILDAPRRFDLRRAVHEHKVVAVVQLGAALIDELRIVGNQAVFRLAEDPIQHCDRHHSAVDQLIEHVAGAYAGQLVRVAHKNDPCVLNDTLEKLLCQPHIHHRKLVHNDEVGIHKANALAIAHFFPGAKPQCAVQRAGFVHAGAFRHAAAGTTRRSHEGELPFRVQVLEHLDDGL